jgi:DivIVA domain-containing protein
MIDLASIRNASFTLTPTGYNPEEVDRFLADLADQLAESLDAPVAQLQPEPQAYVEHLPAPQREEADVEGLRLVIERTIGAMDSFVANELAALSNATELETEEILRERERLLEEAGDAARAHLDETRTRAESILAEARRDGDSMRARFESELQAERERFEQALADRDAQAQARVAELIDEAEGRKREADELVANASRVQTQVLASIEQAKATLFTPAPAPPVAVEPIAEQAPETYHPEPFSDAAASDPFSAPAESVEPFGGTSDAAA